MKFNDATYRWYVLALAALTHTLVIAIPTMALPVLFKEISDELGLNLVQVGAVWGLTALTGIFTGLIGGSLGDRFGAQRTLMVGCVLAGISGAVRGLASDFYTMTLAIFFFGLVTPAIPINVHKTCSIWFSGRLLGLANGVVSAGMALGFVVGSLVSATWLSPWLGSWRYVLLLYGGIAIGMSIPWALTRPRPGPTVATNQVTSSVSMRRAFGQVARLREIWFLGLTILGIGGAIQGTLGYLPLYLREIGWPAAQADGALATFHTMSLLATIPLALASNRLGSRKRALAIAGVMFTGGIGLLSVGTGLLIWVAVGMAGLFRDGFMAIFMTTIVEVKGVGAAFAGTATGLAMVFMQIGLLLAPPIGNSLAEFAPALPFAFWAAMAFCGLLSLSMVKEGAASQVGATVLEVGE